MTAKYNKKVQIFPYLHLKGGRSGNFIEKNYRVVRKILFFFWPLRSVPWHVQEEGRPVSSTCATSGTSPPTSGGAATGWTARGQYFNKLSLSLTELRCSGWARGRAEMARTGNVIDIRTDGILNLASVCIKGENKGDINIMVLTKYRNLSSCYKIVWGDAGL